MLKTASSQSAETLQLPYDEYELLQYIDNEQVWFNDSASLTSLKQYSIDTMFLSML